MATKKMETRSPSRPPTVAAARPFASDLGIKHAPPKAVPTERGTQTVGHLKSEALAAKASRP